MEWTSCSLPWCSASVEHLIAFESVDATLVWVQCRAHSNLNWLIAGLQLVYHLSVANGIPRLKPSNRAFREL